MSHGFYPLQSTVQSSTNDVLLEHWGQAGIAFIIVYHCQSSSIIVYHRLSSSIYSTESNPLHESTNQNGISDIFNGLIQGVLKSYLGDHRFYHQIYKLEMLPSSIKCRSKIDKKNPFRPFLGHLCQTISSTFPVSQVSGSQLSVGFEVPRHGLGKAVRVSNNTSL